MLLKIQTANHADSYLLIDNATNVTYQSNPTEFTSFDDLANYIQTITEIESRHRLVLDPRFAGMIFPHLPEPGAKPEDFIGRLDETRVYRVNNLTYERDGRFHSVVFDTIAYICTDDGKTLERALAGGVLNYGPGSSLAFTA